MVEATVLTSLQQLRGYKLLKTRFFHSTKDDSLYTNYANREFIHNSNSELAFRVGRKSRCFGRSRRERTRMLP